MPCAMSTLYEQIQESAKFIRAKLPKSPKIGVVSGTGWHKFAEESADEDTKVTAIKYSDIPNLLPQRRDKEKGAFIAVEIGEQPVVCLNERFHLYEGFSAHEVAYPVRVLCQLGIQVLFVTNAAGGINRALGDGDLMVITDHINMTMHNPLTGISDHMLGEQCPDMTNAYDPTLVEMATDAASCLGVKLRKGVYLGVSGPNFETPAEIDMFRTLGADAVGMSTVTEVIAARQMGVRVCGLSCITNKAAGLGPQELTEEGVHATMKQLRTTAFGMLREMIVSCKGIPDEKSAQKK